MFSRALGLAVPAVLLAAAAHSSDDSVTNPIAGALARLVTPQGPLVVGTVLDPEGQPAPDAIIRAGRHAFEQLEASVREAPDGDLLAVAVHDSGATPEEIKAFAAERSPAIPIGRVEQEKRQGWQSPAFRAYDVRALPRVVLIGADGTISDVDVNLSGIKEALHEEK
jgi:hypothetical protein